MEEMLLAVATNEGGIGVRIDVWDKPKGCPGLGGWKEDPELGSWFTRMKWPDHLALLEVLGSKKQRDVNITIKGDKIISIY